MKLFGLLISCATPDTNVPSATIFAASVASEAAEVAAAEADVAEEPSAATVTTGQIVNANIAHATTVFLFNLGFTVPFAPFAIPVVQPVPLDLYSQMINLDPTQADGIAISAHCGLHVVPGTSSINGRICSACASASSSTCW